MEEKVLGIFLNWAEQPLHNIVFYRRKNVINENPSH
jgi:hypothetical protein